MTLERPGADRVDHDRHAVLVRQHDLAQEHLRLAVEQAAMRTGNFKDGNIPEHSGFRTLYNELRLRCSCREKQDEPGYPEAVK